MSDKSHDFLERATVRAHQKSQRDVEAAKAFAEYQAEGVRLRARTAELRDLRLRKEAEEMKAAKALASSAKTSARRAGKPATRTAARSDKPAAQNKRSAKK